jgi:hypothetical protein
MKYTLAAAALAHWEAEVRRFAPDEHLRWQQLLQLLPDELPADQLRDALAPIAAKNDKEQALFSEIFERAKTETAALTLAEARETTPPPRPTGNKKIPLLFVAAGIALLAVAGFFWWKGTQEARQEKSQEARQEKNDLPDTIRLYRQIAAGEEAILCPDSALLQRIGGVKDAGYFDPVLGLIARTSRAAFGEASIAADGCLQYKALADTVGRDTVRYFLLRNTGIEPPGDRPDTHQGDTISLPIAFSSPKNLVAVEAVLDIARPVARLPYQFFEQPAPYDHDPLLRAMRFEEPDLLSRALARWAWLFRLVALAVAAALLAWWILWRARKRRKLVAQRDKNARPPYVWPIRIPNLPLPEPGEAFGPALNVLRRRADDEHLLLDLPATVRATIRRGGMARFVFRRQTRPPEYLLLVDRADPRDHRARFYDDLYRLLGQNEVLAVRFFFDGDARLCHNDEHPEGLSLDELLFRYPHHRLLVIATGRRWFSAATGRLAPWTELLARWKDRALLSTLPAADWGRRERELSARFRFAPATVSGLRAVVERFESDEADARLPDPAGMAPLAMPAPVALGESGDLLQTLEQ